MTDRQSVGANATVQNALSGKLFEFASRPSAVRLYATGSAVGLNVSMLIGGRAVVDDQEVNAQNRMPILPDDFVSEGGARPGERLVVRYRNTTAAAITAFSRLDLIPVR
jgi:hypothetical protein